MLNNDYKDMLLALSAERVKFLLVGAYAMAVHGYPRATMDIDIWVMPTQENAEAVMRALIHFGAPLDKLTIQDLLSEDTVFQIGVAPRRIDIMTQASGLAFETAYKQSHAVDLSGVIVNVLSIDDLIRNKKASGRMKDLADVEALKGITSSGL
ncbi:hypothetical protein SAMN02745216_02383 [Desulfatibacillum alkenivorans DSM 16219]|jgi:hypothetical protein|uniref:DUF6036 domain-containing protein n=1 Tax=Desulfatibacillum alkenivorans DSM 16219 TaxID=1121393 RepID=A0A1M6MNT9_9BACT|nr:DUF6036 family nucleotidyltransferase [Desulfatibacillum alkenivorans]SHJ85089.1 hypothetical protein SAMN02745216_02383 [Desulfatibacillum alkenivorans DSM 16219]